MSNELEITFKILLFLWDIFIFMGQMKMKKCSYFMGRGVYKNTKIYESYECIKIALSPDRIGLNFTLFN